MIPSFQELMKNSSVEAVEPLLSRSIGIRENRHIARPGQTRDPLEASFRHALLLCLQDQNDIDNKNVLFHRQAETFTANDIRHTLPYFLGAIDEDRLLRLAQLDAARRTLRQLERRLRAAQSADSEQLPRAGTAGRSSTNWADCRTGRGSGCALGCRSASGGFR